MRLVVENISFTYPGTTRPILTGASMDIPATRSVAIVGPSGSGKTTLLSVLGGLLTPQHGSAHCIDSHGSPHAPQDVAVWVFQTVSLLAGRTVIDNVCLGAFLDGFSPDEARTRALDALATVGLDDRASDQVQSLSGGEAQRVAIARALASNRPVVFADEPTGQLDAATTNTVLDAFFSCHGRTIVLITHDPLAASRCETVLHLQDGKLVDPTTKAPQ